MYNKRREELNRRLGISALQQQQQEQQELEQQQSSSSEGAVAIAHSYYSYQPAPGWRFLMLDGYDVSILGWPEGALATLQLLCLCFLQAAVPAPAEWLSPPAPPQCAGHPLHEQAAQLLEAQNPNENKNSAAGLVGLDRRYAAVC